MTEISNEIDFFSLFLWSLFPTTISLKTKIHYLNCLIFFLSEKYKNIIQRQMASHLHACMYEFKFNNSPS